MMTSQNQNQNKKKDEESTSSDEEESQNSSEFEDEKSDTESEKHESNSAPNKKESESDEDYDEEDEDEDEEKDDDEGAPSMSSFTVKPNSLSKPTMKDTNPASKRSLEVLKGDANESTTNKKARTSAGDKKEDNFSVIYACQNGGFPRVWSLDNEIALLEGAIDYRNQKGSDPSANLLNFYPFVKGSLFSGVSNTQIYTKYRTYKNRFFRLQGTGEDGADPVFSNPFEYKTFQLSKKIWGCDIQNNGVENKPKGNNEVKKKTTFDDTPQTCRDFLSNYPNLNRSFDREIDFLKNHVHLIGHTKAKELEEKCIKLQIEEMEVVAKRSNLMAEKIKLVIDAMKKG